MEEYNIFYATDFNYITPTYISIISLAKANPDKELNVNIMFPIELDKKYEKVFTLRKLKNVKFKFFYIQNTYKDIKIKMTHLTAPTFFRTSIPDICEYDKCLYLDSDTLILGDIKEIYNIDIEDCSIAAVRDIFEVHHLGRKYSRLKYLDLKDYGNYFNAGVLMLNLKRLRVNKKMKDVELEYKNNHLFPNQDPMNIVFENDKKIISPKFNLVSNIRSIAKEKPYFLESYTKKEWEESINKPVIIHFLDDINKPWINSDATAYNKVWDDFLMKEQKYLSDALNNIDLYANLQPTQD